MRYGRLFSSLALVLLATVLVEAQSDEKIEQPNMTMLLAGGWLVKSAAWEDKLNVTRIKGPDAASYLMIKVSQPKPEADEKKYLELFRSNMKEYKPRFVEIRDKTWLRLQIDLEETKKREVIYMAVAFKRLYSFNFGSKPENFKKLDSSIQGMIQSVNFRDAKPEVVKAWEATPDALEPAPLPPKDPTPSTKPSPEPIPEPLPEPIPEPDLPKIEPEPDPTPKSDPEFKPAPKVRKQALNALGVRYGAQLLDSTNEYDADLYPAKHLHDDKDETVWRNRPDFKAPFSFTFLLQREVVVRAVAVVTKAEEARFPGVSAKEVVFEGSTESKTGPWIALATVKVLGAGHEFQASGPKKVRWVRVRVLSNQGHPTLTQIADLRVFTMTKLDDLGGEVKEDPAPKVKAPPTFSVSKARLSKTRNGADDGSNYEAGSRVFLNFKPKGMKLNRKGNYWLSVDLEILGAKDKVVVRKKDILDQVARLPAAPFSVYVSLHIDIPAGFPPGTYKVRWHNHDRLANQTESKTLELVVVLPKDTGSSEGGR